MAKLRLGPVASDIRNSIGGTTFSRNGGGAYARARVTPLNPRSTRQSIVRAAFGANAKNWGGQLTADQRQAWTFFAQSNPSVDVFGAAIILSGIAMFQRLNQVLANIGETLITDAPADLSVPAIAAALSLAVDASAPSITVTTDTQAVVTGAAYYVFATRPLPPGRIPQKSDYRYIATIPPVAAATDFDIATAYAAIFGPWIAGAVVGVLTATVNEQTGAVTPGISFTAVST